MNTCTVVPLPSPRAVKTHLNPCDIDTIPAHIGAQGGGTTTDRIKSRVRGGGRAREGRRGAAFDSEAGPPAKPSRPGEVGRTGLGRCGRHRTTARRGSVNEKSTRSSTYFRAEDVLKTKPADLSWGYTRTRAENTRHHSRSMFCARPHAFCRIIGSCCFAIAT